MSVAFRSERVSKTGVNGVLLTEAKFINLSLHYLEQVFPFCTVSFLHIEVVIVPVLSSVN